MSITIEQIQAIKADAESKRRQIDRAQGKLEQFMKDLKEEYGCENLEEAKQKLQDLKNKSKVLEEKIDKLSSRVVEMWNQINSGDKNE